MLERIKSQDEAIQTLTATVDYQPTAGSVYSGVIKEYHDVRGFILLEKPSMIRMIGQAPIVRTKIFDMVSDGEEFRLYIAPKQKFIVGKNTVRRAAQNTLENMRPQHILQAMLIPPVAPEKEKCFREEVEDGGSRYYVLGILEAAGNGPLNLKRKVWFDRASLDIARLQLYGPEGSFLEDVQYSGYQEYNGVRYASRIQVSRPVEDYRVVITIQKATFNEPLGPDKFHLEKPPDAQLVDLRSAAPTGESSDQ